VNGVWIVLSIAVLLWAALGVSFARHRIAESKGLSLLLGNLTPEQRRQFRAFGYFDARGSATGKHYRIYRGRSRNVIELASDRSSPGRCFLPQGDLVEGDCMLAQKIAIENYEEEVLNKALPF
jgi:hypothetical protein